MAEWMEENNKRNYY